VFRCREVSPALAAHFFASWAIAQGFSPKRLGQLLRLRRIPEPEAAKYEDDDLVPVCLGGDNASPLNHWPQPNSASAA
jgi:hypothetical protein